MTTTNPSFEPAPERGPVGREPAAALEVSASLDDLIDRLVDGDATAADWDAFRALAGRSCEPWRRLAEEQRLVRLLERGLGDEIAGALQIGLPGDGDRDEDREEVARLGGARIGRWSFVRAQIGWAAAILFAIGWGISTFSRSGTTAVESSTAQHQPSGAAGGRDFVHVDLPPQVGLDERGNALLISAQVVAKPVRLYELSTDESANLVLRSVQPGSEELGPPMRF